MSFSVDRRAITRAVLLIAAMSLAAHDSAMAAELSVSGTATYRERIALPDNAALTVRLLDVTRAGDAPAFLGETVVSPAGQVPIAFRIALPENAAAGGHLYAL